MLLENPTTLDLPPEACEVARVTALAEFGMARWTKLRRRMPASAASDEALLKPTR